MEIAVIYMIAAFQFTYSMPQERNFRFDVVTHIVNNLQGSLESVIGVPYSMQKSLSVNDTFFILTSNGLIFKLDGTGSIHRSMSFGSDLMGVRQLILLNNDTQLLAVNTFMAMKIEIIDLSSSDSPRTLLCDQANCCKVDDPTCFELPVAQLGYVAVGPQNPYHLYFVAGSTVQDLDLTSDHPKSKNIFTLDQVPENSFLSLDDEQNILDLVAFHKTTGTYYRYNLTSHMLVDDQIFFSAPAPEHPTNILQLPDSSLLVLDTLSFLRHVDIKRNVTSYVCADAALTSDNATFVVQSKACENPEKYGLITTDGEFVYVLSATGDLSCLNYAFEKSYTDSEIEELSEETTHLVAGGGTTNRINDRDAETTETNNSELESILTITLSTVLPGIALSVGCYFFITRVIARMNRSRSKRQTLNTQQESDPTPIREDIELAEISSQTQHHSVDLDEIRIEVSSPQSTTDSLTDHPAPPQLHIPTSSPVTLRSAPPQLHKRPSQNPHVPPQLPPCQTNREPALELPLDDSSNEYEQPLPFIDRPLPPIPCHGPTEVNRRRGSSVPNRRDTGVAPPLTHQVSSPVNNYCDRTLQDIETQAPESPRILLNPSLLQAVIQSAYQQAPASGNTSLSMTYTPQRIEIKLTHQQTGPALVSEHDYLVINDVQRDSTDI